MNNTLPEGINSPGKKGRPPHGTSFTEILREVGEGIIDVRNSETGQIEKIQRKYALALKMWKLAIDQEDPTIMKLIYDRVDGKPVSTVRNIGDGAPRRIAYVIVKAPKDVEQVQKIVGERIIADGDIEEEPIPGNDEAMTDEEQEILSE